MVVLDNIKHLTQGSEPPHLDPSKPTLYSLRFSPFSERARLVLNIKHIPFNVVNIHVRNRPDWYWKKNPLGKVPTLEEPDGSIVYESLIIAEYLDDKYRDHFPLLPRDPYERAQQKQLVAAVIETASYKHTVIEGDQEAKHTVENGLDAVERMLQQYFWSGNKIGFADLMLWPWFERLPAISEIAGLDFTEKRHPKITEWMHLMLAVPEIKETAYSTKERVEFLETRKSGAINYDVGL
ncbi:glutathione S-transferase omega-1-like [Paramacrobiotus metropolitanus]|uniref:glutathione S-transferase omega-1-like n=1 Tax=Paramacrobiotus metropolitanus TaxID=2943436 RepID=UPI0024460904|nr:glutathione S-transferase omega-1-like [Paramacrobiotus metropolitanus]XP_055328120.1 glutathione S-transferase omega-1-like [Paramacrobiotus metropolitanus]